MKKFGFYLLGKKGYQCLVHFYKKYGNDAISFIVLAKDKGVENDYFDEASEFCRKNGIDFYSRSECFFKDSDINFAIGWRWMIPDSEKLIVFHDSLLPKYRGFSPLVNMLIRGEEKIGVTALFASQEYDSGKIVEQQSTVISYPIKISEAIDAVSKIYVIVMLKIVSQLVSGSELPARPQDKSNATFSLWRDELDYEINWENDAEGIRRFVDAVGYPYAGATTKFLGQWIRVLDVELVEDVEIESREDHLGKVIFMDDYGPTVVCGKGLVKLTNIVDESGNSLIRAIPFRTRFGV